MSSVYRTIDRPTESQIKEKGSRFIGLAAPCNSEAEAKKLLQSWREQHPQATHLCYAWRIGIKNPQLRIADDGEPSNSAGAPIFGQIQSFDLHNLVIGVVRYYGGTKLGVGGLIQAYREAAKEAIEAAQIVTKELSNVLELLFAYEQLPAVMRWVKQHKINVLEQELHSSCRMQVEIEQSRLEAMKQLLSDIKQLEYTEITIAS